MHESDAHSTPPEPTSALSRRELLALSGSWGAHLMLISALGSVPARRLLAKEKIAASKPWGRLEEIGEGIWAVVSTPLAEDDWTTLCNGGLVAGKERTLAIDAYARPAGAAWVGGLARELAGRWPTDVVITHYHGDHVNGLAGFLTAEKPRPRVWITATTLELVRQADAESDAEPDPARSEMLEQVTLITTDEPTEIDLGGRKVRIHPRSGHTASDVTVELDEPSVVFFGDLVWNRMFPNYRDATPSALSRSVRATLRKRPTVNVPGHGPLADAAALADYLVMIDDIEAAARRAYEQGIPAAEAAKKYRLPEGVADWTLFRDRYFEVAISAWYRELAGKA